MILDMKIGGLLYPLWTLNTPFPSHYLSNDVLSKVVASASAKRINVAAGENFQTECLDVVEPGDECYLETGDYVHDGITTVHGTADKRITITGAEDACIKGTLGYTRALQIAHDYYTIEGICFDGDHGEGKFSSKAIYVLGGDYKTEKDGVMSSVTGLRLLNLSIKVRSIDQLNLLRL